MNDLLETVTELIAAVRAEQEKHPSAFLAVAQGGLATAQDNLRHEIDRRAKKDAETRRHGDAEKEKPERPN